MRYTIYVGAVEEGRKEGKMSGNGEDIRYRVERRSSSGRLTFDERMLAVSVELTELVRAMMRFKDDNEDVGQSDSAILRQEGELKERVRKLLEQLKVRGEDERERGIVCILDKQVREVMGEWRRYWGNDSSVVDEDIFPREGGNVKVEVNVCINVNCEEIV